MLLVVENEVVPEYRYLGEEIARLLPGAVYRVFPEEPDPSLAGADGVVLTGSTASVYESEHEEWMAPERELVQRCVRNGTPLLGICFGHQLVNDALGGRVEHDRERNTLVRMTDYRREGVLRGVEPVVPALHGDLVTERGEGMDPVGRTEYDPHFCLHHRDAPVWTVQFHPEFTERFVPEIPGWDAGDHSFAASNAPRVLRNFAALVRGPTSR